MQHVTLISECAQILSKLSTHSSSAVGNYIPFYLRAVLYVFLPK